MSNVKIKGMSCQHCVASVTKALNDIDGVSDVVVNLENGEATYNASGNVTSEIVKEAIKKIGFEAE